MRAAIRLSRMISALRFCAKRWQQLPELLARSNEESSFLEHEALLRTYEKKTMCSVSIGTRFFSRPETERRSLGRASPVSFRVVGCPAHGPATKAVDQVERSSKLIVKGGRGLHTTLGGRAELAHSPALVDHGEDNSDMRRVGEPDSLGTLVSEKNIGSVLDHQKVRDRKDSPGLRRKFGEKNLN